MIIDRFSIHNFRNLKQADLDFSPNFNFIIGQNGSGKTNLLEAIYLMGHGKTFRHHPINRIIEHQASQFTLFAQLSSPQNYQHKIGIEKYRSGDSKIKIDNQDGIKQQYLTKLLPMQLISPESFELLTAGPKFRRQYVDWGCFHHYPEFIQHWSQAHRLLKQRNALLKSCRHYQDLTIWDQPLISETEKLTEIRVAYLEQIRNSIITFAQEFLPEFTFEVDFYLGWNPSESYQTLLFEQFERDRILGFTTLGFHKAELKIKANGLPINDILSRGQLKLLMSSLKLAQGSILSNKLEQPCLYIIDDFGSELDSQKQALLADRLKTLNAQVFITAIDPSQIEHLIGQNDKIYHIKSGIIT